MYNNVEILKQCIIYFEKNNIENYFKKNNKL